MTMSNKFDPLALDIRCFIRSLNQVLGSRDSQVLDLAGLGSFERRRRDT